MKIALICPDYGSQYVGMAKELYDHSRVMQEYFEEASTCLNLNFVRLCFASSENELGQIAHAYPAIFLVSASIVALLKERGIVPTITAGFGIGEFAAAQAAGSLSLPDGLYFLSKFAQFYQELLTTVKVRAIKVIHSSVDTIKQLIKLDSVTIAAINPHELIITGYADAVQKAENTIKDNGYDCFEEPVQAGLHSALMEPVIEQLRVYLEKIDFRDAHIPLIASTDGTLVTAGTLIQEHIMAELQRTIRWDLVMKKIAEQADVVIEVGPGIALTELFKKVYPTKNCININKPHDIEELIEVIEQASNK